MKKISNILALIVMCFTFLVTATGCSCGQKSVEILTVKGGLQYTYATGDPDWTFDNIRLEAIWNDGTKEELTKEDVTISNFSTAVAGTYDVTITYENKSITVKLKVTDNIGEVYDILDSANSTAYLQYEARSATNVDPTLESTFYVNRSDEMGVYVIGDDNPFIYNINVIVDDGTDDGLLVDYDQPVKTVSTLYKKIGIDGTYVKLSDAEVATYVTIDDTKYSYDFKEAAIHNSETNNIYFKLEVVPYNLDEFEKEDPTFISRMEFKVVDGYNSDDAKELGLLYNQKTPNVVSNGVDVDPYAAWLSFLITNTILDGETTEIPTLNGIVLHKDLKITPEDIPFDVYMVETTGDESNGKGEDTNKLALYTKGGKTYALNDQLDDEDDICESATIYCHKVAENSTFNFYGNYFRLENKLPTVETGILPSYGSTSTLFRFVSNISGRESSYLDTDIKFAAASTIADNTIVNIYNLDTIGNAARTDINNETNLDSAGMGGLIFVKSDALTLNVHNTIIKNYLIALYLEENFARINAKQVKSYDNYNSFVYSYLGGIMTIDSCEFKRAGGPAIIADTSNDPEDREFIDVTIVGSTIESLVTGGESWFNAHGLSGHVGKIKAYSDKLSELYDSGFTTGAAGFVNVIAVIQSTDTIEGQQIYGLGRVVMDGKVIIDTTTNNPASAGIFGYGEGGAPVFQKGYELDGISTYPLPSFYLTSHITETEISPLDYSQHFAPNPTMDVDGFKANATEDYIGAYFNMSNELIGSMSLVLGMSYYLYETPAA